MSVVKSLDQKRAAYAWEKVGSECTSAYVSLAKAAPSLIMQNGLMQALAFYTGKGGREICALRDHIVEWLAEQVFEERTQDRCRFESVMDHLHGASAETYLRATEEALEVLRWIRQYAAARTKKETA